jgi:hypothetical protein
LLELIQWHGSGFFSLTVPTLFFIGWLVNSIFWQLRDIFFQLEINVPHQINSAACHRCHCRFQNCTQNSQNLNDTVNISGCGVQPNFLNQWAWFVSLPFICCSFRFPSSKYYKVQPPSQLSSLSCWLWDHVAHANANSKDKLLINSKQNQESIWNIID